jgi:hypothetical protein
MFTLAVMMISAVMWSSLSGSSVVHQAARRNDVQARRTDENTAATEHLASIWEARGQVVQPTAALAASATTTSSSTPSARRQGTRSTPSSAATVAFLTKDPTTRSAEVGHAPSVAAAAAAAKAATRRFDAHVHGAAGDGATGVCQSGDEPVYGPLTANETTAQLLQQVRAHHADVKTATTEAGQNPAMASILQATNRNEGERVYAVAASGGPQAQATLPNLPLAPASAPLPPLLAPLVKSHRSRQWTMVGSQTLLGAEVEKVEGQTLTYQWRQNGVDVPGATSALYVISRVRLEDAGTYTCAVSNGALVAIWEEVMLHVSSPPEVTFEFRKISATKGARLALAVPFVMANPAPTFQWRLNGVDIPGAVSQQYDIEVASEADVGTYTCFLENLAGNTVWEETIVELRA